MVLPQCSTPERRTRLVQLVGKYKGRCLRPHLECRDRRHHTNGRCQGHPLCQDLEHYVHTFTKVEVAGRMIVHTDREPTNGTYPVLSPEVSWLPGEHMQVRGRSRFVQGKARVPVQHEELSDLYGVVEERVVETWKQEDREERRLDGKEWVHVKGAGLKLVAQTSSTGEVGRFVQFSTGKGWRRRMDPIEMETHVANRPKYYLQGYGVDDKLRRYAKARIPGTNIVLHVDVSQSIQELSQRKRKWLHKQGIQTKTATALIEAAVAQWWTS